MRSPITWVLFCIPLGGINLYYFLHHWRTDGSVIEMTVSLTAAITMFLFAHVNIHRGYVDD